MSHFLMNFSGIFTGLEIEFIRVKFKNQCQINENLWCQQVFDHSINGIVSYKLITQNYHEHMSIQFVKFNGAQENFCLPHRHFFRRPPITSVRCVLLFEIKSYHNYTHENCWCFRNISSSRFIMSVL